MAGQSRGPSDSDARSPKAASHGTDAQPHRLLSEGKAAVQYEEGHAQSFSHARKKRPVLHKAYTLSNMFATRTTHNNNNDYYHKSHDPSSREDDTESGREISPAEQLSLQEVEDIINYHKRRWTEEGASEAVRQATLSAILAAAVYASETGDRGTQDELQRALARLAGFGSRLHRARRVASFTADKPASDAPHAPALINPGSMTESMSSSWSSSAANNASAGGSSAAVFAGLFGARDLLSRTKSRLGKRLSVSTNRLVGHAHTQRQKASPQSMRPPERKQVTDTNTLSLDERMLKQRAEVVLPEQAPTRKLSMRLSRKLSFSLFSSSAEAPGDKSRERRLSFTSMVKGNRRRSFLDKMGGVTGMASAAAARLKQDSEFSAEGSALATGGLRPRPVQRGRACLLGRNPERLKV